MASHFHKSRFAPHGRRPRDCRTTPLRGFASLPAAFCLLLSTFCLLSPSSLPAQINLHPTVPESAGVDIHFTDPRPGEMKMLAASGVRWVRMDITWVNTERTKGQYDFSAYDRLMAALAPYHIRAMLILCYTSPLYDQNLSPYTDEGRQAFAAWARAAVEHFQGRGVLWEMYNEPNWITFWRPKPNVDDYIKLALAVGEAIEETAPGETYIGPAAAVIDPPFLESCFKAGLLNYWSAVTVHPYRQQDPETTARDFAYVRGLIAKYAPKGKEIPIVAGEWGYPSVWNWDNISPAKQAELLAREYLVDLADGVPLTIWYEWRDDGADPKNYEQHFGLVLPNYTAGRGPVYTPKPAYVAVRALTSFFAGFRFAKRLDLAKPSGGPSDYALLFRKGTDLRLAAWTTGSPHKVLIPASRGKFDEVSCLGARLAPVKAGRHGLSIALTSTPKYLRPVKPNALLRAASLAVIPAPSAVIPAAPAVIPAASAVIPAKAGIRLALDKLGGILPGNWGASPVRSWAPTRHGQSGAGPRRDPRPAGGLTRGDEFSGSGRPERGAQ